VDQLEVATGSGSYEQAITSGERGEDVARLIACGGLTEGEADLLRLPHDARSRSAELKKNSVTPVDTPAV
jgi:hypothetical protein